jgi:uncharacterized membrane protein
MYLLIGIVLLIIPILLTGIVSVIEDTKNQYRMIILICLILLLYAYGLYYILEPTEINVHTNPRSGFGELFIYIIFKYYIYFLSLIMSILLFRIAISKIFLFSYSILSFIFISLVLSTPYLIKNF